MNSLKAARDEHGVIGSIRLQLKSPLGKNKVYVIVEGQTDLKLFINFFDTEHQVDLQQANGGCEKLRMIVLEILKDTPNIIGIKDADFMHLSREQEVSENIFLTDQHDLEMMQIASDSTFYKVINEYLSDEREPLELRRRVLISLRFIAGLRWINETENLGLNFKNLGLTESYQAQDLTLNQTAYLKVVLQRSANKKRELTEMEVAERINEINDLFNLCNGHDFQKALALYINSFGSKGIKEEQLGSAFRLAYTFKEFQKTVLYQNLQAWQLQHKKRLFVESGDGN